jgi:hypothetical protein
MPRKLQGPQSSEDLAAGLCLASQDTVSVSPIPGSYSEGFGEALDEAHEAAASFYERSGIEAPQPGEEMLQTEGEHRLQRAFGLMNYYGLEPDVVVSREGLDLQTWRNCFSQLSQAIHAPVIISGDMGPGVSSAIETDWDELGLLSAPRWVVSVVAASQQTPYNLSHDLRQLKGTWTDAVIQSARDSYPTFAEYLTLQAVRYQSEQEPIDLQGFTWLRDTAGKDGKAPLGKALSAVESAAITRAPVEAQAPNIYIRPAVREIAAA